MVLVLLSNFSPYLHFLKKIVYFTTKYLSSAVPSFTKIRQRNFEILKNFYMKGIISFILLHEKFVQFDWLRAVVFQLNLKYLHVKIANLLQVVV